jgi:transcriptional regulator with XRE-family HTH domain
MSFPKKGKFFTPSRGDAGADEPGTSGDFVEEVGSALRRARRNGGPSVKQVATWTGASEKTVKNWFAGRYGPNGAHLVELARHSDDVLGVFLALASSFIAAIRCSRPASADAIADLLAAVRRLGDGGGGET